MRFRVSRHHCHTVRRKQAVSCLPLRLNSGLTFALILALFPLLPAVGHGQNQLTVNFAANGGPVMHGASGWLYGQAESGIPSNNLMAPLKPQIAAQKPPKGIQHAGGDVTQVTGDFLSSGGEQMEVYLQDIYQTFYPPYPGISSYNQTVSTLVRQLVANPYHASFVYDPFNEPDGQWYGKYKDKKMTNVAQFLSDWKTIYQTIRSIDPSAVIVGPSFYNYDPVVYREFLTYAKANHVIPNQISWHELQEDFYSGWYSRYSSIHGIEETVGIAPLPIVINEYGLRRGTLGNPGNLIQWISRFETSKVYGCVAFWVPEGNLGNMAAAGTNNQATGSWWLYKWYGSMTGDTIAATTANMDAAGLAGVASVDTNNKQARILLGGASGDVEVALKNLGSASYLGNRVHVTIWGIDRTDIYSNKAGNYPSAGPYYLAEQDYTANGGQLAVTVPNTNPTSAYLLIVTPAKSHSNVNNVNRYEAEYADLSGAATVTYGNATGYSGTYFVQGYGTDSNAHTEFDITAPANGFYNVDLRYSSPKGPKALRLCLNGPALETILLAATSDGNTWADATARIFLNQGINRITYSALANTKSDGVQLDYIDVTAVNQPFPTYEAAATGNTVSGNAARINDSSAPGGTDVGYVGQGATNYLQFNKIHASTGGLYRMLVTYANGEIYSGNKRGPVFRFAEISVNGGRPKTVYFNNTFSSASWFTQEVDVYLNAGENTIRFSNSTTSQNPTIESGWAPELAKIQIAPSIE